MGAAHPREPGADWTKKDGKSHFGYKLHIGMDEQTAPAPKHKIPGFHKGIHSKG